MSCTEPAWCSGKNVGLRPGTLRDQVPTCHENYWADLGPLNLSQPNVLHMSVVKTKRNKKRTMHTILSCLEKGQDKGMVDRSTCSPSVEEAVLNIGFHFFLAPQAGLLQMNLARIPLLFGGRSQPMPCPLPGWTSFLTLLIHKRIKERKTKIK